MASDAIAVVVVGGLAGLRLWTTTAWFILVLVGLVSCGTYRRRLVLSALDDLDGRSVRLDPELRERLTRRAHDEGVPVSEVIRKALRHHLEAS